MSANPLKSYARTPRIYVKLPSESRYYGDRDITLTDNNEVPIRAMTASDEIVLNNPDALLNGDAIHKVLKSCVEGVADTKKLSGVDVNTMLLGIRFASRGDELKFSVECPGCKAVLEEKASIRKMLDMATTYSDIDPSYCKHTMKAENDTLVVINLKPTPYAITTAAAIVMYEQTRTIQFISSNPNMSTEERNLQMKELFEKTAGFHINTIVSSVESVDIVQNIDGEQLINKVTDVNHIHEFIIDLESTDAKDIQDKLKIINNIGIPQELDVACDKCEYEFRMEVKFDPANFSEKAFSVSPVKTPESSLTSTTKTQRESKKK